jgi:hypothetical protein
MMRAALFIAVVVGLLVGCFQVAFASEVGTHCPTSDSCTVTVTTPGTPGGSGSGSGDPGSGSTGGSGDKGGGGSAPSAPVPPPCTYAAMPTYQPPAGTASHAPGSGAWYQATCYQYMNAAKTGWVPDVSMVWLATPPTQVLPAPAQLAAEAQSQLKLASPVIESNPVPGQPQMVGIPMWSWLGSGEFAAVSATASVPGESVTATATPVSVTWNYGDGTSQMCAGPGTPYAAGSNPLAASPTCGHLYTRSSGSGTFTVSATINWTVNWAGGGQSGAFDGLATTTAEQVRVEQSQALITGG